MIDWKKKDGHIYFCEDVEFWNSVHRAYSSLLLASLSYLLELGLNHEDAQDVAILNRFMRELGRQIQNK